MSHAHAPFRRALLAAALLTPALLAQQPVTVRSIAAGAAPHVVAGGDGSYELAACAALDARAWHGQAVPGGGTLSPIAFANPAVMGTGGRVAFFAQVDAALRNQGIFVADAAGLHPVAMGCGGGGGSGAPGGCGDPSPIGGTFSGMFGGTFFCPSINASGDVLFYSEVLGGSSSRGLFLHDDASGLNVKVAVIGDASPLGGTFSRIGPGSLNDAGEVVFLAQTGASAAVNIHRWKAGVLSTVAAVGDPAPGGGTFSLLGTESVGFVDGTDIPVGPVPAINASGQVAFRAIVGSEHRLIVSTAGVHQLYLTAGDPTPAGGTYNGFEGPNLNDDGEVAFFSDVKLSPGVFNSGLFVGLPGAWRKAVEFFDPLPGGGICFGLAITRNPMTPLDDAGNFLFWTNAQLTGGAEEERLLVSRADGVLAPVAAKGDATPLGGTLGSFQAFVSMRDGSVATSASTPGAPGIFSAHFEEERALTWVDVGHALAGTAGKPRLRGEGGLASGTAGALHLTSARASAPVWLLAGFSEALVSFKGGVLVPSVDLPAWLFASSPSGALNLVWSSWPPGVPPCTELVIQMWVIDAAGPKGAAASNGLVGRTP
ncbi:MAG TPA: choice-of-anchor tandem repeat NxxGxxAF-containing protein [Planctomycetota bacterium]|nr:choice-of-anchor tandem repeat NxxGxxAF-containing protein [Planctomycetota bacterium]